MKYRRIYIVILILCLYNNKGYAISDGTATNIAEKFYKCLQIIAEENYPADDPNTENSTNAQNTAISLCFVNDINLPNEFTFFGNYEEGVVIARVYLERLKKLAIDKKNVRYRAQITQTKAYEEIKAAKSENSTNFYSVYVSKTISVAGVSKTFIDTVLVCVDVEKGGLEIAKITNSTTASTGGESVLSLRGRAAELFSQKKYQEAYDTYLKVIKKDYKQGDAYYRLALMAYHNLGCKNRFRSKKARLNQAYDYIKLAEQYGNYEIKKYASRVEYYMLNGSV